jgi:hypothetical protein
MIHRMKRIDCIAQKLYYLMLELRVIGKFAWLSF